jgi:hypothetical protein
VKSNVVLAVTSLLSILLITLHISGDIVLGFAPGGFENLAAMGLLVVYLCGALLWIDGRVGQVIVLLGSMLALVMPVLHMRGAGVGVNRSAGQFFFIFVLYALGVTGPFGIILSVRALLTKRARLA